MCNSVFLSVSDFFFEKLAYFGHFELVQDDADGFLWLRFYSVWTSSGVIFSNCRERCPASDRVDSQVRSRASFVCISLCCVSAFRVSAPGIFLKKITQYFENMIILVSLDICASIWHSHV